MIRKLVGLIGGLLSFVGVAHGVVCTEQNTWEFYSTEQAIVGFLYGGPQPLTLQDLTVTLQVGVEPNESPIVVSTWVEQSFVLLDVDVAAGCPEGCREGNTYGITATIVDNEMTVVVGEGCIMVGGPQIPTPTPTPTGQRWRCVTYTPTASPTPTPTPIFCCGDCNGNFVVSQQEYDDCNAVVGQADIDCPYGRGCDCAGDGTVGLFDMLFILSNSQKEICPDHPGTRMNAPMEFD